MTPDIPSRERWGPFANGLDEAERRARLRALRALTRAWCGPDGIELGAQLARSEWDPTALPLALHAIDRLPSRSRKNLLTSYAALDRAA